MPPKKHRTGERPTAKPMVDELLATRDRMNRANVEFLKIDVETALTFLKIARETDNDARKQRNCRAARTAYDTVVKLIPKVDLTDEDAQVLNGRLNQLRSELESLGDSF